MRRKWKEKKHSCLLRAENISDESEKSEVAMCLSEDGNSWKNRKSFQYQLPLSPRGGRGAMIFSNIFHICTHFYALVKIPCHLPPSTYLWPLALPSPTYLPPPRRLFRIPLPLTQHHLYFSRSYYPVKGWKHPYRSSGYIPTEVNRTLENTHPVVEI